MPAITVKVGTREPLRASILKATPMGALATEAVVHLGQLTLSGPPAALRALAAALTDAADLAETYDRDPEGYGQRERDGEL
jgi:hypothetical protein